MCRKRFKTPFRHPWANTEIAALPSVARNDGVRTIRCWRHQACAQNLLTSPLRGAQRRSNLDLAAQDVLKQALERTADSLFALDEIHRPASSISVMMSSRVGRSAKCPSLHLHLIRSRSASRPILFSRPSSSDNETPQHYDGNKSK